MPRATSPLVAPAARSPLIARAVQSEALRAALDEARRGHGQCALLVGEAGIGKSRLLREFAAGAAAAGVQVLRGYGVEDDLLPPYAPLAEALRQGLARCAPGEAQALVGPLGPELVKVLPELALTGRGEIAPTPALAPELEKRRLFEVLARFLGRLAQRQPLALILEDVHWSDETTLDFLAAFTRRLADMPLLLVLSTRPQPQAPAPARFVALLHRDRLALEIDLPPLSLEAVDAHLRALFGWQQPVARPLLHAIYALTEGNPYFVEEVAQALVEAGDIYQARGEWRARPIAALPIPHSLRLIVQQRTGRLSPPARDLLAVAAVAGHTVDFDLLAHLTGQSEPVVLSLVRELVQANLLAENQPDTFVFRHALTREAIYSGLLSRERRAWHLAIARYYAPPAEAEPARPANPAADTAHLAYHYHAAGAWAEALHYGTAAGVAAQAGQAPHAALAHLARAAAAAEHLGQPLPLALLRARGQAHHMAGNLSAAQADFEAGLAAAQAAGDRHAEWQAMFDLGYLLTASDYAQAGEKLQQALRLARALNDPAALAHSLNRLGNWHANMGQPMNALALHEEAQAIFTALDDAHGLASTLDLIGSAHGMTGNIAAADRYYRRAVPLFEALGDRQGLASTLLMLGGNGEAAAGERAVAIASDIGWRDGEAYAHLWLANMHALSGDLSSAEAHAERGAAIVAETGHAVWQAVVLEVQGTVRLVALDYAAAARCLAEALALARAAGARQWIDGCQALLALTHVAAGEPARAAELLSGSAVPTASLENFGQHLLAWAHAETALAQHQPGEAIRIVAGVLAAVPDIETWNDRTLPMLRHVHGRALAALGDPEAAPVLAKAAALCAALGQRPFGWRIHADLARLHLARRNRAAAEAELSTAQALIEAIAASVAAPEAQAAFRRAAAAYLPTLPPLTALQQDKRAVGGLTRREREVAALVAQGKSNREIAETLFVSVRTTKTHVSNILAKLNLASRAQLAAWAQDKPLDDTEQ